MKTTVDSALEVGKSKALGRRCLPGWSVGGSFLRLRRVLLCGFCFGVFVLSFPVRCSRFLFFALPVCFGVALWVWLILLS